jgi:protoporphyrin/coproporphyrin ferrochelatase
MTADRFDAVLLLAFGGPARPEDIRPFLDNVLRGRPVPQERYDAVVQHYIEVGGSSPLGRLTEAQAEALRGLLRKEGPDLPVFVGMRHWHPFINDTLGAMAARGLRRAVGIVLAAHPSQASREAYFRAVAEAQRRVGPNAPGVEFVEPWYEHPLFVEALAARLRTATAPMSQVSRDQAALLFTAHSIPAAMSEESGYERALRRTAELVAEAAGAGDWRLVYQSRSGSPQERWLEPDVCEAIAEEARRGASDVVVAPIGFLSDHVEVLYDLDIEARAAALDHGLGFHRAGTAGDHPAFARLLATLVRERAAREPA